MSDLDSDIHSGAYQSIFKNSLDAILITEPDGSILRANPAAQEMFGRNKDEILVRKINRLIVQNHAFNAYTKEITTKGRAKSELTFKREDGSLIIGEVSSTVFDEDGIGKTLMIIRDITLADRVKYREQIEYHAYLLSQVSDAVIGTDSHFKITYWNKGSEQMYGYKESEALGKDRIELIRPEHTPYEREQIIKNLKNENNITNIITTKHKNGNEIIVESNSTRITDELGNITGYVVTYRDITEREEAENKLKKTLDNLENLVEERTKELLLANNYNRNLIETSLDPLVTIGPDGKITDVNLATEKVTGYKRKKLIGTDFADYFTDPEKAETGYQQVFKQGMVKDYPLEIKNKDGTLTPVLYNASVYRDESGEVIGVFAAARDISERRDAENKLKEYWESLEEQVKLRTEELAKSNADLKQFAYVASHDLREPLRMITSFLQLLERRYSNQLDDDAKEFIGFAVDGARRLDKMIMDLLEYSRIANKEMMFSDIDFEEVMEQIILNLNVIITENNANITYENLPKGVMADENQMILLFQNIINNAIKYRSKERPEIQISATKEGGFFIFNMKDNGIGIDNKHLERIFTIFQRLHTHQEYEGSGIGLSIAQRIVHQHGGEIWVESELGRGSTFHFTIKN